MKKLGNRRTSDTDRAVYERQAAICKAFAHPSRLQLLDLLGKGEQSCGDLQQKIGVSKANLSQHISQLKSVGVVFTRREGKQIFCSIAIPEVKQACQMIRNVLRCQLRDAHRMLSR